MRNMKKGFAVILSASMVMGLAVPAMAATEVDGGTSGVDIPIYSLDIDKVVVPSTYEVAFNPGELEITTGSSTTSKAQILSRNFGIINQSSKAKVVTVGLNVEDQNTDSPIKFVGSAADVDNAGMDDYAIYLEAVPADTTEIKVGSTPAVADQNTTAADLGNVEMTKATAAAMPLSAGENELQFVLGKAIYSPKSGNGVELGTTTGNDVASNYELTGLAADGKGITAFTLTGSMNKTAEWHKLTNGIKITPTYTLKTVTDDTVTSMVKSGTGAVYENPIPQFSSREIGKIAYTTGSGDDALATVNKVEMTMPDGKTYDGYTALTPSWGAATDENNTITLQASYLKFYQDAYPDDSTQEATVTYTTEKGETMTKTVDVKLR